MIRYALVCERQHDFESWFQNSAAYDKQVKRGRVAPPPTGPAPASDAPAPVSEASKAPVVMMSPQEREFRQKLRELREHLTKNADYVGQKFPQEARKMHYGEIDHRSIYGEASPQDAKDLHEEGIEFHPLPVLPDERN